MSGVLHGPFGFHVIQRYERPYHASSGELARSPGRAP
jgi:hypothetical protein